MFIPFCEKEIDALCDAQFTYVALDITATSATKKYMVCDKLSYGTRIIATFRLLDNADLGCIVNFTLHGELGQGKEPKYRQLYLIMALRCVKKWAVLNNVNLLCVHTDETLMPEIFIDNGFALRKSVITDIVLYRGSLLLKEQ